MHPDNNQRGIDRGGQSQFAAINGAAYAQFRDLNREIQQGARHIDRRAFQNEIEDRNDRVDEVMRTHPSLDSLRQDILEVVQDENLIRDDVVARLNDLHARNAVLQGEEGEIARAMIDGVREYGRRNLGSFRDLDREYNRLMDLGNAEAARYVLTTMRNQEPYYLDVPRDYYLLGLFTDHEVEDIELAYLRDRPAAATQAMAPIQPTVPVHAAQAPIDYDQIGISVARAMAPEALGYHDQYKAYQDAETWCEIPLPPKAADRETYLAHMSPEEVKEHTIRTNLGILVNAKKTQVPGLKELGELNYAPLNTANLETLYHIPGVRKALETYISLKQGNTLIGVRGADTFSLVGAKGKRELLQIREYIRQQIAQDVINGFSHRVQSADQRHDGATVQKYQERGMDHLEANAEMLAIKCRDAEQIAFNMLYIANTFEANDADWRDNGERNSGPVIGTELIKSPLRDQFMPLDAFLETLEKPAEKFNPFGTLGAWAREQLVRARGGVFDGNEVFVLIDDNKRNDYWKVERRKGTVRVYIPELYPVNFVKSLWDETSVDGGTLLDKLAAGQPIPWNKLKDDVFGSYSSQLKKAAALLEFAKGEKAPKDGWARWGNELAGALSKFERRLDTRFIRWAIYANAKALQKDRLPKILNNALEKQNIAISLRTGNKVGVGLGSINELFFPWDRV